MTGQATSGDCVLSLYARFKDFMKHPRYHVGALCNTIEEQIEDVDGEETHNVLNHIRKIRALLWTSEPELHELDRQDEYDEDVEKEEPIYFTTREDKELAEQCARITSDPAAMKCLGNFLHGLPRDNWDRNNWND